LETGKTQFRIGDVRFDASSGILSSANSTSRLEPKAGDVLALLCAAQGSVVSRERLLDECWQGDAGSDEGLTQAVAQIRRALETVGASRDILSTHPKRGYSVSPAGNSHASGRRRAPRMRAWLPLGLLAAAIIMILIVAPHWPRHVIRHALGWGPHQHHGKVH
jgi:DNA-binding winged helix-turn-helix (wHTH) protein